MVKRTERGWAGHFICADRCKFRRNTLLEKGDVRIVISTVGLMTSCADETAFEKIGLDRYFETLVFHASYDGRYWDADVSQEISVKSPCFIDRIDAADLADKYHEDIIDEISQRIRVGEFDS